MQQQQQQQHPQHPPQTGQPSDQPTATAAGSSAGQQSQPSQSHAPRHPLHFPAHRPPMRVEHREPASAHVSTGSDAPTDAGAAGGHGAPAGTQAGAMTPAGAMTVAGSSIEAPPRPQRSELSEEQQLQQEPSPGHSTSAGAPLASAARAAHSAPVAPTSSQPCPPFHEAREQQYPGSEAHMQPKPDYGELTYRGTGKLIDRVAVITGGDSGIGRAVALAFAREGCHVVISYLNEHDDADEAKRVVEAAGRRCILVPGDLSQDEHCKSVIDAAVREFGTLDLLVNNAAYQGKSVGDITHLDRQRVEYTFATNILSMFSLCRYAVPHMRKGGSIINVASIQAYDPSSSILDYAATKGAIITFTKGLAAELLQKDIRCNCVAPGPVWTPLVMQSFPRDKLQQFGANYPIGRPAQPCELAPSFVFLASNDSTYVNGEVLGVTGGAPLA